MGDRLWLRAVHHILLFYDHDVENLFLCNGVQTFGLYHAQGAGYIMFVMATNCNIVPPVCLVLLQKKVPGNSNKKPKQILEAQHNGND